MIEIMIRTPRLKSGPLAVLKGENSGGFSPEMGGNLYLKGENYRSFSAESSEIAVVKGENSRGFSSEMGGNLYLKGENNRKFCEVGRNCRNFMKTFGRRMQARRFVSREN